MNANTLKVYKQFLKSTAPFRKSEKYEIVKGVDKNKPLTKEQKELLKINIEYFKALGREYKEVQND